MATKTIVLTNGCFDVLHAGHISCLQFAKAQGDKLIVAVNSDDSVRRLKGPNRPINPLAHRMDVLAALRCVDAVIPFYEDTVTNVILALKPDVWVKGGDYTLEKVNRAERLALVASGTRIVFCPSFEDLSTTNVLAAAKIPIVENISSWAEPK